jgi:hypothetical protein
VDRDAKAEPAGTALLERMQMRTLTLTLSLLAWTLIGSSAAHALTVSFGDSVHYWPGHANGTSDDAKDTIGTPDLLGGRAIFTGGRLTSIEIDYTGRFSPSPLGRNGSVIPGDLFINDLCDDDWDYVMKLVSSSQMPADYAAAAILDLDGEAAAYRWTGSDNTGHWSGFGIRDRHPYAWKGGGTQIDTGSLTGVDLYTGGFHTLVFNLGRGLQLSDTFCIGFGPSCANDVIFERIHAPVPEPSAALLFAASLLLAARGVRPGARSER